MKRRGSCDKRGVWMMPSDLHIAYQHALFILCLPLQLVQVEPFSREGLTSVWPGNLQGNLDKTDIPPPSDSGGPREGVNTRLVKPECTFSCGRDLCVNDDYRQTGHLQNAIAMWVTAAFALSRTHTNVLLQESLPLCRKGLMNYTYKHLCCVLSLIYFKLGFFSSNTKHISL